VQGVAKELHCHGHMLQGNCFFFSLSEFALIEKKTKEKKGVIRYNKLYGVHGL
jgi:hypothetical protein